MGTLVRLYVGWRLLRLLRPILGAAAIAAAVLALYSGHVAVKTPASSPLLRGAATAQRDLQPALEGSFYPIAALTASSIIRASRDACSLRTRRIGGPRLSSAGDLALRIARYFCCAAAEQSDRRRGGVLVLVQGNNLSREDRRACSRDGAPV